MSAVLIHKMDSTVTTVKAKRAFKRKAQSNVVPKPNDSLNRWCMGYVGLAAVMSMGLNA